jgi:uncharacterized protein YbjT (DUF2867 family)
LAEVLGTQLRKEQFMKIVVVGGTGLIGSKVVAELSEHGHDAVAAAPSTGVNSLTGEGLADALAGASVVIDVSNSPSWEDSAVLEFFETSTRNLLAAAKAAGIGHYIALSIVGTERLPDSGYLRAKVVQERLIKESGVPYSIVHATQFFEFVPGIADGATYDGTVYIHPVKFQPLGREDLARAVCRTAVGAPLLGTVDVAGPRRYRMDEFFRSTLAALQDARPVVTDEHARYFGTELADDSLVPTGKADLGELAYEKWQGTAPTYPVTGT